MPGNPSSKSCKGSLGKEVGSSRTAPLPSPTAPLQTWVFQDMRGRVLGREAAGTPTRTAQGQSHSLPAPTNTVDGRILHHCSETLEMSRFPSKNQPNHGFNRGFTAASVHPPHVSEGGSSYPGCPSPFRPTELKTDPGDRSGGVGPPHEPGEGHLAVLFGQLGDQELPVLKLSTAAAWARGFSKSESVSPRGNIRFNPTTIIGNLKWVVNSPTAF